MSDKSCMQFIGYKVNSIQFSLTENFENNSEFHLSPTFEKIVNDRGNNTYEIALNFYIKSTDGNPMPFNIEVKMTGCFSLNIQDEDNNLKQELLNRNTVAIMFPFLRSIVTSITSAANIPPLVLPVINISNLFDNADNSEKFN